jgi:nucleoside-diphosphate-sugar epimerase
MKILVTGGAGFIGTNLCTELRARGNIEDVADFPPGMSSAVRNEEETGLRK